MSNNCKISNKLNFISPSHIGYNSAITLEILKPQDVNQYGLTNIIQMQVADLKLALQIYNNKKVIYHNQSLFAHLVKVCKLH